MKNKEKEWQLQYYQLNRDKLIEYSKNYYQKHKDAKLKYNKEYRKNNIDKYRMYCKKHYEKIRNKDAGKDSLCYKLFYKRHKDLSKDEKRTYNKIMKVRSRAKISKIGG